MSARRTTTRSRTSLVLSALTAGALLLTACGGSSDEATSTTSPAATTPAADPATSPTTTASTSAAATTDTTPVTITVDSFGGIFDNYKKTGLLDEYKKLHPNVTVTYKETQQEVDYWTALQTKLQAGTGAADIQPIEIARVALVTSAQADKWVDLRSTAQAAHTNDYTDAKKKSITTKDGAILGFGTDSGPMAICYRTDKLKAAGIASTSAELAAKIKTFDDYESVGKQYKDKTGKAWMDASTGYYRLLTSVKPELNYNSAGEPTWSENETVHPSFDRAAKVAQDGLTAKLEQFSQPWNTAMNTGDFATIACPAWMLAYIKQQAGTANSGNWGVIPLPGGTGGNWGGTYLSIPKSSKNVAAAAELAAFLTGADAEVKEFKAGLAFPSNIKALPQISGVTDAYFSGAPIGQIFSASGKTAPYQPSGVDDGVINDALADALNSVENNGVSAEDAWDAATTTIEDAIGG